MRLAAGRLEGRETRAYPWLLTVLRRSPIDVVGVLCLSVVTTVAKLLSIVTGVISIQTQLTDRSLGGPWALLGRLPISGSGTWLLISFGAAATAVLSERSIQRLRASAAERACVEWLRGALRDGHGTAPSLANVGKTARTAVAALLWGAAVTEMLVVLLGLGVVHPMAALVALVALAAYSLVETQRGGEDEPDPDLPPERNHVIELYSQLLASFPRSSTARAVLLDRAANEPRVLAPVYTFLNDQRTRTRQATEAPLVLAVMIGALYLLALVEGSSDPVEGAASLAISFLLIRILVGSILRLTRAASTVKTLWSTPASTASAADELVAALRDAPGTVAIFGVGLPLVREAVEEALDDRQVISLTRSESVALGLSVGDLASGTDELLAVGSRLKVDLSAVMSTDVGEAPLEARLALLLASQPIERSALVVAVMAWLDLPDSVRHAVVTAVPAVVLVHPTLRSGVPDDVQEVIITDEDGQVTFRGDVAAYRASRLWERRSVGAAAGGGLLHDAE